MSKSGTGSQLAPVRSLVCRAQTLTMILRHAVAGTVHIPHASMRCGLHSLAWTQYMFDTWACTAWLEDLCAR